MQKQIVRLGSALLLAAALAGTTALASQISGAPNTASDWTQEFCLTDCTSTPTVQPVTQVDLIMATPGVTFTSMSPVYLDIGQTTLDNNATSMLGATTSSMMFNPANSSDVYWTTGFSPTSTSTPFSFYLELWNGSNFITSDNSATSSDTASWNGSTWNFVPLTAAVPEPASFGLLAAGLIALAGFAIVRRRRASAIK